MRVPDDDWFKRVLLYWDSVETIVPNEMVDKINSKLDSMKEMVDCELVRIIDPLNYISSSSDFDNAVYKRIIENNSDHMKKNFTYSNSRYIHILKMNHHLVSELKKEGLVKDHNDEFYRVEAQTAAIYMHSLASYLGSCRDQKSDPITNKDRYFDPILKMDERIQLRERVLEALIPVPADNISFKIFKAFKDKHYDLLMKLRFDIEEHIGLYSTVDDLTKRNQLNEQYIEKYQYTVNSIIVSMKKSGWKNISIGVLKFATQGLGFLSGLLSGNIVSSIVGSGQMILALDEIIPAVTNRYQKNDSPLMYSAILREQFSR